MPDNKGTDMWTSLTPIIARYGVEFAYQLWGNIKSNKEPTEDDWQLLKGLAEKRFDDYLFEAQRRINTTPGVTSNPNP